VCACEELGNVEIETKDSLKKDENREMLFRRYVGYDEKRGFWGN